MPYARTALMHDAQSYLCQRAGPEGVCSSSSQLGQFSVTWLSKESTTLVGTQSLKSIIETIDGVVLTNEEWTDFARKPVPKGGRTNPRKSAISSVGKKRFATYASLLAEVLGQQHVTTTVIPRSEVVSIRSLFLVSTKGKHLREDIWSGWSGFVMMLH